jgi:hypothetical protein
MMATIYITLRYENTAGIKYKNPRNVGQGITRRTRIRKADQENQIYVRLG